MVRRGPKRSVLCAQSEELHQKRACLESDARHGVGKFERGGGLSGIGKFERGGVRIFGRGVREKGGSDEPPEPPLVTGLENICIGICKCITCLQPFEICFLLCDQS